MGNECLTNDNNKFQGIECIKNINPCNEANVPRQKKERMITNLKFDTLEHISLGPEKHSLRKETSRTTSKLESDRKFTPKKIEEYSFEQVPVTPFRMSQVSISKDIYELYDPFDQNTFETTPSHLQTQPYYESSSKQLNNSRQWESPTSQPESDLPIHPVSKVDRMNKITPLIQRLSKSVTFKPQLEVETFKNNVNGGPYLYTDKSTYQGQYLNGQRCGLGQLIQEDGSMYTGNWEYDKMQGQGIYIFSNGSILMGYFLNNKLTGKGKIIDTKTSTYYEGEILQNRRQGQGKMEYKDGSVYFGEFKDNLKNGHGKFQFKDKSIYRGSFIKDKIEGYGKLDHNILGELVYEDGRYYKGQYKDSIKHGKGSQLLKEGVYYEGDFNYGKKEGKGVLIWADGNSYEGEFFKDFQDGNGVFYDKKKNKKKRGIWNLGKRVKWIY